MTTLYVTYPGDARTRFDRGRYVTHHLPLVMRAWGPHGLLSCSAFFPAGEGDGTIAIAECKFRDEAALTAALASPETPRVMADVPSFTDVKPMQSRAAPV